MKIFGIFGINQKPPNSFLNFKFLHSAYQITFRLIGILRNFRIIFHLIIRINAIIIRGICGRFRKFSLMKKFLNVISNGFLQKIFFKCMILCNIKNVKISFLLISRISSKVNFQSFSIRNFA